MRTLMLLLAGATLGCSAPQNTRQASEPTRAAFYRALVVHKVLQPGRELAHLSYICSLEIDGAQFGVIDVQELITGSREPRGLNRIAILDRTLRPVCVFEYLDRRPLFCNANRLYLYGDLSVDNIGPEGKVLTFSNAGKDVSVSRVEANDVLAPVIRDANEPPQ